MNDPKHVPPPISPEDIANSDFIAAEIAEETEKAHAASSSCKDAADWLDEPDEPDNPLIFGLVECGANVAIVGPAKSAKTWLEAQIATCIATGRPWFGRNVKKQRVYVANIEVSAKQYKKRLRSICSRMGITRDELRGQLFVDNLRGKTATWEWIRVEAKRRKAETVIIDPFYQVFKGKETDEGDCQNAIEEMKKFLADGLTLFIVYHAPKGKSGDREVVDMISGSSVLVRFPENVIAILPHASDPNVRVIDCSVLRDYAPPEPFSVKFDSGALILAPDIPPDLKHSGRSRPYKSPAEKDAEKVKRLELMQKKLMLTAQKFLAEHSSNPPNATVFRAALEREIPKPYPENFVKDIRGGAVAGLVAQEELWRHPKTGRVGPKGRRSGGVTFIMTEQDAQTYRERFNQLPLT